MTGRRIPFTRRWWRSLGTLDRIRLVISAGLLVSVLGALGWLSLHRHFTRAATGDPCEQPDDCRSGECLTESDYQPSSIWSGIEKGIVSPDKAREMDSRWNSLFDPLAPGKDEDRPVGVARRYCTQPCKKDSDCPPDMVCAQTLGFEPSPLGSDEPDEIWISGEGLKSKHCVYR